MAESKRQQKFAKLIRKDLGDIFQKEGYAIYGNAFVTITEVKMSPDLGLAKVYISVMMVEDKKGFVKMLNEQKHEFRGLLGRKIGKQVRAIPELIFYLDETLDRAERIDQVLNDLNIPPSGEDE